MASSRDNILPVTSTVAHERGNGTDRDNRPAHTQAKTLAITSGKGGVGKSNITTNLAITLAQKGARVCIFDADTSLANVNILMRLNPQYNIEHLLTGAKTLDEIIISGPANVSIVPASSGLASLDNLNEKQQARLISALEQLEQRFDYLLIDTAAGIGNNVTRFLRAARSILLVISTEPTSLTDAFALLRVLKRGGYKQSPYVLVNMAINYGNGMEVFKRFEGAVRKYLGISLNYVGYITDDSAIKDSVRHQCPVVLYRPNSLATRGFINLEKVLANRLPDNGQANKFSTFWNKLLTPNSDDIETTGLADTLASQPESAGDSLQKILNDINTSELNSTQLLFIIQELSNALTRDNPNLPLAANKNQQQLNNIIRKLTDIYHGNINNTALEELHNCAIRLSKSGGELEQNLDSLNTELEKFLK